jgi:uncharacterized membrane protein YbhN (UPF0104 family)
LQSPTSIAGKVRRAIPLFVALAICAFTIHAVTWGAVIASLGRARMDYFLPLSACFVLVSYYIDCAGLWVLILKSVMTAPFKEVILVRAVTQFAGSVNIWVGRLGMAFHYSRRSGLPMTYMIGVNVLLVYMDLACAFLFCGMVFRPAGGQLDTAMAVVTGSGLILLPLLLFSRMVSRWRLGDLKDQSIWYTRNGLRQFFAPLILMPFSDLLLLFVARVPHYPIRALYLVLALRTFNVQIPVSQGLVAAVFTAIVASLPVTPLGFGLLQAAGLLILGVFGEGADIVAALLMVSAMQFIGNISFGLYYLKGGVALMRSAPQEEKKPPSVDGG